MGFICGEMKAVNMKTCLMSINYGKLIRCKDVKLDWLHEIVCVMSNPSMSNYVTNLHS